MLCGEATGSRSYGYSPEGTLRAGLLEGQEKGNQCFKVRFISPTDPRWLSTMRAIEQDLVDDSLVYRYKIEDAAADGLMGMEGTFGIASFWYVEALGRTGDVNKARFIFEKLLGYANHVGLYAEEIGAHGEHLGNFPQAFTHLALISAAFDLDRRLSGARRRG